VVKYIIMKNRLDSEALGQSEPFLELQEQIGRVAPVDRPVLLIGERGTGKELAASRLHYLSRRWDGPMITLNCSSLSPHLIEAELFGYVKGAFTGADRSRQGRFERADGGTLFLDELGTIPPEVQEKILRVVEYGSFEPVGSEKSVDVDVRIIGATNADLPAMVRQGRFKADLLDRLSFEVITLPPLRYREEDILLLANHFSARIAFELDRVDLPRFSDRAEKELMAYSWPGNIRELKNVVERAVYKSDDPLIDDIVFDPFASPYQQKQEVALENTVSRVAKERDELLPEKEISFKEAVRCFEAEMLRDGLEKTRYNQKKTAALLGLSYDQLRGLMKKYKDELNAEGQ
jgi:psp operon transcriptional activator